MWSGGVVVVARAAANCRRMGGVGRLVYGGRLAKGSTLSTGSNHPVAGSWRWLTASGSMATGAVAPWASRGFSTDRSQAPSPRTHQRTGRNQTNQNPQWLFEHMKGQLESKPNGYIDYKLCNKTLVWNLHQHPHPSQGLANALELVDRVCARQPSFMVATKTWGSIVIKMALMGYPKEDLVKWIDAHPVQNAKPMVYVITHLLEHKDGVDLARSLLMHYAESQHPTKTPRNQQDVLNSLVDPFLRANPSISSLESYLEIMRSSQTPLEDFNAHKLLSYCWNPMNHPKGCEVKVIAKSFVEFVRKHDDLRREYASAGLSEFLRSSSANKSMADLEQELEEFMARDPKERETYVSAVNGHLDKPADLYELAQKIMLRNTVTPMDYVVLVRAISSNIHHHEDAKIGLSHGVVIAKWMADQPGVQLPFRTWNSILLKMVVLDYPVSEMTKWMDTQPVTSLTSAMIYVLSNTLKHDKKVAVALELLKHCLQKESGQTKRRARTVLVTYLFDSYLQAKPSIQELTQFVSLLTASPARLILARRQALVTYYVDPAHHDAECSSKELARKFLKFWKRNETVLKGDQKDADSVYVMASLLSQSGSDGVQVAQELSKLSFSGDQAEKRRILETVVQGEFETRGVQPPAK